MPEADEMWYMSTDSVGGSITGCTTAYGLARHPAYSPSKHCITLFEPFIIPTLPSTEYSNVG
jgi:glycine/D-amino acid oxidase-like deaminating enzyme